MRLRNFSGIRAPSGASNTSFRLAWLDALDPLHANDCCYTFGPKVETSEHCNVFLYYWPKTADVTCF